MRTVYVNVPGRSCDDKPIKRRVLLLSDKEWNSIKGHGHWLQKEMENADMHHLRKKQIFKNSKAMASSWKDTVENTRIRRLKLKQERYEKEIKEKDIWFAELRAEKEEEKRRFLKQCKLLIHYNQDQTKTLNSALRFSEVLRERDAQINFNKKQQELARGRDDVLVQKMKKDVEAYEREKVENKHKLHVAAKKNEKILLKQIREHEKMTKQKKKLILAEQQSLIEMKERLELAEKRDKDLVQAKKIKTRKALEESLEDALKVKQIIKEEEELDDKITAIRANAKQRIDLLIKKRTQEERYAQQKLRDKVSAENATLQNNREVNEQRCLANVIAEIEAREKKEAERKEAFRQKMINDRKCSYEDYLTKLEKENYIENEMKKWDALQLFKKREVMKEKEDQCTMNTKKIQKQVRETYLAQMRENEARLQEEREEDIQMLAQRKALDEKEHEEFFQYAEEVIEDSRKKGRPLYPLMKAVQLYKVHNGLIEKEDTRSLLKSQLPFGPKQRRCLCPNSKKTSCGLSSKVSKASERKLPSGPSVQPE